MKKKIGLIMMMGMLLYSSPQAVNAGVSNLGAPVVEKDELVVFSERATLHNSPDKNSPVVGAITPQKVYTVQQQENYRLIMTWLGPKWVYAENTTTEPVPTVQETVHTDKKLPIYKYPTDTITPSSYISPQKVVVTAIWGDYKRINTWIGPQWIKYTPPTIVPFNQKITLTEKTTMYEEFSTNSKVSGVLAPQTVTVTKKSSTGYYLVNTWLGERWIKPSNIILGEVIAADEKISIPFKTQLYSLPDKGSKMVGALAPQTVRVNAKWNNWVRIDSYVGNVWIYPITKTVILDAGHGGKDVGAVGLDGTREADINLQFALKSKTEIEKLGYRVVMSRTNNSSCLPTYKEANEELQCRVNLSAKHNADIFVSIHSNSATSSKAYGTELYYNNSPYVVDGASNPFPVESKTLGNLVYKSIQPAINSKSLGVKTSNFYVLRKNTVPAVLIETGFLSNASDLKLLKSSTVQEQFAKKLALSIQDYFK